MITGPEKNSYVLYATIIATMSNGGSHRMYTYKTHKFVKKSMHGEGWLWWNALTMAVQQERILWMQWKAVGTCSEKVGKCMWKLGEMKKI